MIVMNKYFGYMPNDFINGEGVSVSLWTAGCPHHCPGCHNKHMWDYDNGYVIPVDLIQQLSHAITDNGIMRNLSILGGEPLAPYNLSFTQWVIQGIRQKFPNIKIFIWTGYTLEELQEIYKTNIIAKDTLNFILENIDILIDGRYEEDKRDITLKLRGSTNQRILYKGKDF